MTPPNPPSYYRGLHMLRKEAENCQNLNIWAPKTLNGEKKPVLVWMHGGGYTAGNALEEYSFDGFNLCHYGDIVFVSINHRLNLLAHMNLSEYGQQFEKIFSTLVLNFAKYGDPNNKYLPKWEPITDNAHNTMVIDRQCALQEAYDEELVELFAKANSKYMFRFG